jgi:hypothetical protein
MAFWRENLPFRAICSRKWIKNEREWKMRQTGEFCGFLRSKLDNFSCFSPRTRNSPIQKKREAIARLAR